MARATDKFTFDNGSTDNNTGTVDGSTDASTGSNGSAIDPVDAREDGTIDSVNNSVASGEPRRRGRPKGSKNRDHQQKTASQDIGAIQALLLSVHGALATQIPELSINEMEAKVLADNIIRLEQYYPKFSAVLTGKVAAHVAMISCCAAIYGPRFAAIGVRMKREKEEKTVNNPPFRVVN